MPIARAPLTETSHLIRSLPLPVLTLISARRGRRTSCAWRKGSFPQTCVPVEIGISCTAPRLRLRPAPLLRALPESSNGLRPNPGQSRYSPQGSDLQPEPLPSNRVATTTPHCRDATTQRYRPYS